MVHKHLSAPQPAVLTCTFRLVIKLLPTSPSRHAHAVCFSTSTAGRISPASKMTAAGRGSKSPQAPEGHKLPAHLLGRQGAGDAQTHLVASQIKDLLPHQADPSSRAEMSRVGAQHLLHGHSIGPEEHGLVNASQRQSPSAARLKTSVATAKYCEALVESCTAPAAAVFGHAERSTACCNSSFSAMRCAEASGTK